MERMRRSAPSWAPDAGDGSGDRTVPDGPADRAGSDDATHLAPADPSSPAMPRHIGPYHIKRRIAAGGMGVVYEAVQENPRRSVALKLMKPGLLSPSALRRFEFEAQLLARLHHPGIAQIYQAGTHEEGGVSTPYFAMEYIPGALPMTDYAERKKLDFRGRLELFRQACDAVHHGHQKGIIHRDLKPDNLLVDSRGQVKVIDFGVARSTDSDLAMTTMQTSVGQLIGTLQYMSPEQIHGDPSDIDTRSDVYSLGVILYELLCGTLPYDVRGSTIVVATRVIQETAPQRPSTVDRRLRGDVETIVLKALEKDRDRRYQSAHGLSADIGRFLTGEPIAARAPSLAYHVRMFARRNKAVFAGVIGVVVSLAAGLAVAVTLFVRAEDARKLAAAERDRARAAEQKAQAINDFLLDDLLGAADPAESQGRDLTVKEVVHEAAGKVGTSFEGRPGLEVPVRLTLGRVFRELADYEEAEAQAEAAEQLAREKFGAEDPRTLEARRARAEILTEILHADEAVPILRDVLEVQRRLGGDRDPAVLATRNSLGAALMVTGAHDEAESVLGTNAADCRAVLGEGNEATIDAMLGHADALSYRWNQTDADQDLEGAIAEYQAALDASERYLGGRHPMTLTCLNNFASLCNRAGRFEQAVTMSRRCLEIERVVYGDTHPNTLIVLHNIGMQLLKMGRTDEALETVSASLAGWNTRPFDARSLNSVNVIAENLIPRGRSAEAESVLVRSVADAERHLDPEDPSYLRLVVNLGWAYRSRGELAKAEPYYRRTLEGRTRSLGPDHQHTLRAMAQLGGILSRMGRPAEGERLCREALQRGRAALPEGHPQLATLLQYLGQVLLDTGHPAEAEPLVREAVSIREQRSSPVENAECESLLAGCLLGLDRFPEAEELLARAYPVLCRERGADYDTRREARLRIEDLCRATGRARSTTEVLAQLENADAASPAH